MNPFTSRNSSDNTRLAEVDAAELLGVDGGNAIILAAAIATIIYVMGEAAYAGGKVAGNAAR